jgi:hypothetical protein
MHRVISATVRRRSVRSERRASPPHGVPPYLLCLCLLAVASGPVSAQTAGPPVVQGNAVRPEVELESLSEEALLPLRATQRELLLKHQRDGRSTSARGAIGSVTVAARCVQSFVVNGSHRVSAQDVRIVAAEPRDCDGGRCRVYQVTAARDSTEPFDLEVSVTCS